MKNNICNSTKEHPRCPPDFSGANFLGIDLTSTEVRPSACLGLDEEAKLIYCGFLYQDSDIIRITSRHQSRLVAIDAPLSLPRGLCCLEESCSCQPEAEGKGRDCERELAVQGIPCYFTTKNLLSRLWFIGASD